MRARNLKPGFFKNEVLADCDPLSRILFAGLWCMADREGRIEYRPKRIKAELLPYDSADVTKLLTQLRDRQFIICYPASPVQYIQIINFLRHQNPHIKEAESTIPAPDLNDTCTVQKLPLTESLIPHPSSLILNPSTAHLVRGWFERFWKEYPKKKSKADAEKAFRSIKPDEQLVETMISKIEQAKTSEEWLKDNGQFIPYPATWLRGRRWEDEVQQQEQSKWFSQSSQS